MRASGEPKTPALRDLYWREEILQVMFWIEGEGFGTEIDPATLARYMGVDPAVGVTHLDRLVREGYLVQADGRYSLSARGRSEGARVFADEFSELTNPAHGECGPECWCHRSAEEAEACAAERAEPERSGV